ncbi:MULTISPECIES: GTP cyclohydrolase I FolE [Turicibacter]|jgi:GTP cyclohydrolase I|uniref:GTP cyclohydrolase 1 n=1 Tax=Turicibacter sanguinis PC909 TaxID=702450 RepID=A0ABM9ZZF2_9FIRM|nr:MULTISPECIES: GTP cyclohydrolase I FolE [Turicibacter]EFF62762.1 GTP cyclohydrolase I [Turicibacter sanguinis PC909]EGC91179.1 GTP cyclohydrolase I [Turicibacter sp. HGF1]MBP3903840.1 GTP cyclohydrolase I FolE [Turicibacter sp.]MCU7191657.1 GTP cyclohydrolase I FolE [Turicibacter sanguinis]MCU7197059.1 GTP cyclohydrolase I FolE [Turicibacter sanguinis]
MSVDKNKIEEAVKMILEAIGENPSREGLIDTPARVARMYEEVFSGLHDDPKKHLQVYFSEEYDQYVLVQDIVFHSMCEHHLLPFFGRVHVAYYPENDAVVGLSKIPRVVDIVSKRPQLQERMGKQIGDAIVETLQSKGVMVVIEAEHMCMVMRGIKKPGAITKTIYSTGVFKEEIALRQEVLNLIKG